MEEGISRFLQEDLITLLCFDDSNGKIIRNSVELELFESYYHDIARRVYGYIDQFKEVPKENIASVLDDIIEGDDKKKADLYKSFLWKLFNTKDTINSEHIISRITEFVRKQRLKAGIQAAAEAIINFDDLEKAEEIIEETLKQRASLFDPGIYLSDQVKSLDFLLDPEKSFPTGIPELDTRNLGPCRKRLHLFIGLLGSGKSWWMVNLGRRSIMSRFKVCHITLEMSEIEVCQRYYQNFFALSKRPEKFLQSRFEKEIVDGQLEHFSGIRREKVKARLSLQDDEIKSYLMKKSDYWGMKFNKLLIKQFPTGSLTIRGLKAYLDMLEQVQGFIPDLLIIDYPDLMNISSANYRFDLSKIYKDLRGIAVERNIAVVAASQSNREGMKAKRLTAVNIAESFEKGATADVMMTYNQTEIEHGLGLARLYIAKGRNDEDKFEILISQNYKMGQFVLDSVRMKGSYWDEINMTAGISDAN
jgi:replicative DNA helicase